MKRAGCWIVALGVSILMGAGSLAPLANPGDIYAEVMASPASARWLSPGHAFVCISYHLSQNIKETCYGFYSKNESDEIFIGASGLANEFEKKPERFSRVSWSIARKIDEEQRKKFLDLVGRVNAKSYRLLSNNCGDFVHDAVDLFGWKNVPRNVLPEPYVRDLLIANIVEFRHTKGTFKRSGADWVEQDAKGAATFTFQERSHDDTWVLLRDDSRSMDLRLPIRGGISEWRTTGSWNKLFQVAAIVP